MEKYLNLVVYLVGMKKSPSRILGEIMVSANDLEKRILVGMMRSGMSTKEVVDVTKKFNTAYHVKHDNSYIVHYRGETLMLEHEKYNHFKAEVFNRYIKRYYSPQIVGRRV
jgi:hypothetical protein